jgi:branched-chain amino acid transport system ATP-binding protein
MTSLLEVNAVSRTYGGVRAVQRVSLQAEEGEIVGIIGPNGAGKTTHFNLLSRAVRPDAVSIQFAGRDITRWPTYLVATAGIARTFQHTRLFSSLTVMQNLTAVSGWHGVTPIGALRSARSDSLVEQASRLLEIVGLAHEALTAVTQLPYGHRRRLEIARALALEPRLLLLDEPCAGMGHGEAEEIVQLVRQLRDRGYGVLLIEHNMNVVMAVADRLIVLDHGEVIAEGSPDTVAVNPRVIEAYLGSEA